MRDGELRFWLRWMLASALAWGFAALLFWILIDSILAFPLRLGSVAVGGAVLGLVLGTAQWLVLRSHVPGAGWWVAANVVAGALGLVVSDVLSHIGAVALLLGAVIGAAQWPVLRRWVGRAGWWVPANMVAWLAGRTTGWAVATLLSLTASGLFDWGLSLFTGLVIGMALGGMLACAITGAALVWLLRRGSHLSG